MSFESLLCCSVLYCHREWAPLGLPPQHSFQPCPPLDNRVWVRLTHSLLWVWTNECNLSHPSNWFRNGQ